MFNTRFAVETADRAIKSFAQGLVVYIGGATVNVWSFEWLDAVGTSLGYAALSIATSFASGSLFKHSATPASALPAPE